MGEESPPLQYSKKSVRKVGKKLAHSSGMTLRDLSPDDYEVFVAWRRAHIGPLQNALDEVRDAIPKHDDDIILVGRLKRAESIVRKLQRKGRRHCLDRLGDIAGVRLILRDNATVENVANKLINGCGFELLHDYINHPAESGYRGIHLKRCYPPTLTIPDNSVDAKSLPVEVQVRSHPQHEWATAVEAYDNIVFDYSLKNGDGSPEEREFFCVASRLINDASADAPHDRDRLKSLNNKLGIMKKLDGTGDTMYLIRDDKVQLSSADSCLISAQMDQQIVRVTIFHPGHESEAASAYSELERKAKPGEVYLLARACSWESLRRAYPNYYMATDDFNNWLKSELSA